MPVYHDQFYKFVNIFHSVNCLAFVQSCLVACRNNSANRARNILVLDHPPDGIAKVDMTYVLPGEEKPTWR